MQNCLDTVVKNAIIFPVKRVKETQTQRQLITSLFSFLLWYVLLWLKKKKSYMLLGPMEKFGQLRDAKLF